MSKKRPNAKRGKRQSASATALRKSLFDLLRKRFPGVDRGVLRRYESALLPLLLLDGEKAEPDYSKPGEWGKRSDPHLIYVWRSNGRTYWEEIIAGTYGRCDEIVVEAAYRERDVPCPPKDGFASLVAKAERKAREMASDHPCPDDCRGTWIETIYKKWYCEEDDAVAIVQARRLCNVI